MRAEGGELLGIQISLCADHSLLDVATLASHQAGLGWQPIIVVSDFTVGRGVEIVVKHAENDVADPTSAETEHGGSRYSDATRKLEGPGHYRN